MKRKLLQFPALTVFILVQVLQVSAQNHPSSIIIEIRGDVPVLQDSITLEYNTTKLSKRIVQYKIAQHRRSMKWHIASEDPIYFYSDVFKEMKIKNQLLAEPGDSLVVQYDNGVVSYKGKGFEKFELKDKIESIKASIPKPSNPTYLITNSIADYLEWHNYLKCQYALIIPLIESYQKLISPQSYKNIKLNIIWGLEEVRHDKFGNLYIKLLLEGSRSQISEKNLCSLFDTTFNDDYARWMRNETGYFGYIKDHVKRDFNFSRDFMLLTNSTFNRMVLYYEKAKKVYTGQGLVNFLKNFMITEVINHLSEIPDAEKLLYQYYSEPVPEEDKAFVKEYELAERELRVGRPAPNFYLLDNHGKKITKNDLVNKISLLYFGFAECRECELMQPALEEVRSAFSNDTNVVFLNISTDTHKNQWLKNIKRRQNGINVINVYTQGQSKDHPAIRNYNVVTYPKLYLVGPDGKLMATEVPDPRYNSAKLVQIIKQQTEKIKKQQWVLKNDGPYLLDEKSEAYYIINDKLVTEKTSPATGKKFFVHTDQPEQHFEVEMKTQLQVEPSTFERADKIMALSDVEGNFSALRQLLQANKIIDTNYNWIFGNGHLVLVGDMVDRGYQVTECLWLIYSLEEKAKAAGGYVHFILGNHEIMNLSGDLRYLQDKYKVNATKMGMQYGDLINKKTELGKWLRTKNIVEKIGGVLFVHAGISKEINDLHLTVEKINELARPFLDKDTVAKKSANKYLPVIFHARFSPFWYRMYYYEENMRVSLGNNRIDTTYKTPMHIVDQTLDQFKVGHIVTGHTIFKYDDYGKYITSHYEGKVINTDTHHARGHSEALLIEGNNFYRVNKSGGKVLLFQSDRNYTLKNK